MLQLHLQFELKLQPSEVSFNFLASADCHLISAKVGNLPLKQAKPRSKCDSAGRQEGMGRQGGVAVKVLAWQTIHFFIDKRDADVAKLNCNLCGCMRPHTHRHTHIYTHTHTQIHREYKCAKRKRKFVRMQRRVGAPQKRLPTRLSTRLVLSLS